MVSREMSSHRLAFRMDADGRSRRAASRLRHFIDTLGASDLDGVARLARDDPQRFWAAMVDDIGVEWTRRFDVAMDTSPGLPWTRFWRGGKLNLAHNAVTRWARRAPGADRGGVGGRRRQHRRVDVCRPPRARPRMPPRRSHDLGVGAGDSVGLCLPMIPETVVALPRLRVARSHRGAALQRLRRRSDRVAAARLRRQGSGRC